MHVAELACVLAENPVLALPVEGLIVRDLGVGIDCTHVDRTTVRRVEVSHGLPRSLGEAGSVHGVDIAELVGPGAAAQRVAATAADDDVRASDATQVFG